MMPRWFVRAPDWFVRSVLVAIVVLVTQSLQSAQSLHVVERVVDGDTVILSGLGSTRLIGVDTPETVDPRRPVEAFGKEAAAFLRQLVERQTVRVEYDATRKDRYDRTLAYLYLTDGTFVNAEIVKQGYGHAYTEFPFKYLEEFRAIERTARAARRGLWSDAPPPLANDPIVVVTRTGTKYHRITCPTLRSSRYEIPLTEAAAKYQPCDVCDPPVPKP